ncbi:MAG: Ktr system potassium transporter B [Rhizobiales bacterium]|nr:Ktr system potassium transporter B [Hyphomicrobiales bacterium]
MVKARNIKRQVFRLNPPATIALGYLCLVAIGTVLLKLPIANNGAVTWYDAVFISTSAVTVTGLAVVDPGSSFTFAGQLVIAILVQLGGLGLMTFTVLLFSILGMSIGMPQRMILREDLNQVSVRNLTVLVRIILVSTFWFEMAGVTVLAVVFVPEFGMTQGLWHAVFHTISAFNNAGFALFPDGLSRWAGNPIINIAVPFMFIVGGLGFVVIGDIIQKRRWDRLALHSKMVLSATAALIVIAWVLIAALEWNNPGTLGAFQSTSTKLWASWFQAVTPRTAGFNTINIAEVHDSTSILMMMLMVVGGGSTSTAGGIKVTSLMVLILATIAFFKRQSALHIFGRSLGNEEVMKVMALMTISIIVISSGIFIISISHDGDMLNLAFEVVSAFGTVGLSRGATAELDPIGRAVIIIIMFIGRVGPLTLGFFLATRTMPRVRYPAGQIYLG